MCDFMDNKVQSYEDKLTLSTGAQALLEQLEQSKGTPTQDNLIDLNLIRLTQARTNKKIFEEEVNTYNHALLKFFYQIGLNKYTGAIIDAKVREIPAYEIPLDYVIQNNIFKVDELADNNILMIDKSRAEAYAELKKIDIPKEAYDKKIKSKWVDSILKMPKL